MDDFRLYKSFSSKEQAQELTNLLEKNDIKFDVVNNSFAVDITMTGNIQKDFQVRIQANNFKIVQTLVSDETIKQLETVDPNHYLFQYSTKELYEILLKQDEWSSYDYQLSKKILLDRGEKLDENKLTSIKKNREKELEQPPKNSFSETILGFSLFLVGWVLLYKNYFPWAIGLILISFIMGNFLWKGKKILPSGNKIYIYFDKIRNLGKWIVYLNIIVAIIAALYFFIRLYNPA